MTGVSISHITGYFRLLRHSGGRSMLATKLDPAITASNRCKALWASLGHHAAAEPNLDDPSYDDWQQENEAIAQDCSLALDELVRVMPASEEAAAEVIDAFLECEEQFVENDRVLTLLQTLRKFLRD
jgi:hypothetical protein